MRKKHNNLKFGILFFLIIIVLVGFIITQEVSKNKIGDKFKLKPEEVIVSDPDNIKIENNIMMVSKSQMIIIKGYKHELPTNTKVSFLSDGSISIEYPEDYEIKEPEVSEENKKADIKFIYSSINGKLKLPSGDSFDSKLSFEVKNNIGQFFSDDKKTLSIGKLTIDNKDGRRIDLFFDGIKHDSTNPYLSIGKEKLTIANNLNVNFLKENRFLEKMNDNHEISIEAKDKGYLTITNRGENIPLLETYGDFKMINGVETFGTLIDSNNKRNVDVKSIPEKSGKQPYPMDIFNYESDGKVLFSDKDGNKYKITLIDNKWQAIKYDEKVLPKKFSDYSLGSSTTPPKEEPPKTEQPKTEPPRFVINPENIPSVNPATGGSSNEDKFKLSQTATKINVGSGFGIFDYFNNFVKTDPTARQYIGSGDRTYIIHEAGHYHNKPGSYIYGIDENGYLMKVEVPVIGVKKSNAKSYIPPSVYQSEKYFYDTYFSGVHANKDSIHAFEDVSTYWLQTEYSLALTEKTGKTLATNSGGGIGTVGTNIAASTQPIFVGMMLRDMDQKKKGYWSSESGDQYRAFMKKALEESMRMYNQAQSNNKYSGYIGDRVGNLLGNLRTNDDSSEVRKFLIDTYGSEWTNRVLGF